MYGGSYFGGCLYAGLLAFGTSPQPPSPAAETAFAGGGYDDRRYSRQDAILEQEKRQLLDEDEEIFQIIREIMGKF